MQEDILSVKFHAHNSKLGPNGCTVCVYSTWAQYMAINPKWATILDMQWATTLRRFHNKHSTQFVVSVSQITCEQYPTDHTAMGLIRNVLCVFNTSAEAALRLRLTGLPEKRFFTRLAMSVPVDVSF